MPRKFPLLVMTIAITVYADSASAAAPVDVSAADNAFGFRLLNAFQKTSPDRNVVLSPVSAALDLSMALNGATGETKREMLTTLSLPGPELGAINKANAELIKAIKLPAQSVTLSVADSLWADDRRAILRPDYVKQTQEWYDAQIINLNFSSPSAVGQINSWASNETHGRISRIINDIGTAEVALLLNAVYFKGQWTQKFDSKQTQLRNFTLSGGAVKKVLRMAQSGQFAYFATPDMQAIRLPFGAGDWIMQVFLPAKSSSLRRLEEQLTAEHWADWQARYVQRTGAIELPRFELKGEYELNESLQALGMRRAFRPDGPEAAELTGMFSPAPQQARPANFFISSVRQSTYWKVDEEGSEAAAVTSVEVHTTAVMRRQEPFQMSVDRPFFCVIEDRRSGALLFVGAIYDPTT
jgi:serine protease inhibitor